MRRTTADKVVFEEKPDPNRFREAVVTIATKPFGKFRGQFMGEEDDFLDSAFVTCKGVEKLGGSDNIAATLDDLISLKTEHGIVAARLILQNGGVEKLTAKQIQKVVIDLAKSNLREADQATSDIFDLGGIKTLREGGLLDDTIRSLARSEIYGGQIATYNAFQHGAGLIVELPGLGQGDTLRGLYLDNSSEINRGELVAVSTSLGTFGGDDPIGAVRERLGLGKEGVVPMEWYRADIATVPDMKVVALASLDHFAQRSTGPSFGR